MNCDICGKKLGTYEKNSIEVTDMELPLIYQVCDNCIVDMRGGKMRKIQTPIYQPEDCPKCIFLGNYHCGPNRWLPNGIEVVDLYYCPQNNVPTLIARYGNDGDYISGWMQHTILSPGYEDYPLIEALNRAINMGIASLELHTIEDTYDCYKQFTKESGHHYLPDYRDK